MNRGRPKLPEGEKMVHVSVRLPQWMLIACRDEGNPSVVIRKALSAHFNT